MNTVPVNTASKYGEGRGRGGGLMSRREVLRWKGQTILGAKRHFPSGQEHYRIRGGGGGMFAFLVGLRLAEALFYAHLIDLCYLLTNH